MLPKKNSYPKQLLIGEDIWRVRFVKKIKYPQKVVGLCDPGDQTIYIKTKMDRHETLATFIHEVLHAIGFSYDIKILEKERFVQKMEVALTRLITEQTL